jgi:hypothetical protein
MNDLKSTNKQKLKIQPLMIRGVPTCHDDCESRCLSEESQIGKSGCYSWNKSTMGECPENPKLCKPWEHAGFRVEIILPNGEHVHH